MSGKSAIEWTDATWNPTTGCDRVSPGCANCYALTLAARLKAMGQPRYQRDGDPRTSGPGFGLTLHADKIREPLRWRKPRMVFVNSMSDLFHEEVPDDFLDRVFRIMGAASQHTFQVLTKRPERARDYFASGREWMGGGAGFDGGVLDGTFHTFPAWPFPNVWLGTSVENQRWADERIPLLLDTPAAVRFLSCEPLLKPVTFRWRPWAPLLNAGHLDSLRGIDWIIVGGESGQGHRPVEAEWVRTIRDQAVQAGVAFFFKQWGGQTPKSGGRTLDGREWNEMPNGLTTSDRTRSLPASDSDPAGVSGV